MPPVIRNRRQPADLTEDDVAAAIDRIRERDPGLADEAGHIYDTLTWGEGPGQLRRAGVQDWLWYRLATKYLTDEVGYMGRLAETAAVLFDELGLDAYAALCRDDTTAAVHAAFERSDGDGFTVMRKAMEASGIAPPDLDDFAWGDVMGFDEANARSAAEDALEAAIHDGDLMAGGRGWRNRQREITAAALDAEHPGQPGQTWRTAVTTERIEAWVRSASMRSERIGWRRAALANRLLHAVDPPADVAELMAPATWLLERFGDEQALTQAGYLNRAFVVAVHTEAPWEDDLSGTQPPSSEADHPALFALREWLQSAGALRKRGKAMRRTERGASMASDPASAWQVFVGNVASSGWDRFVFEDAAEVLVSRDGSCPQDDLFRAVAEDGADLGWQTSEDGASHHPSVRDVRWALGPSWNLMELFGLGSTTGDWKHRVMALTPAGKTTMQTVVRLAAAGPKDRPW